MTEKVPIIAVKRGRKKKEEVLKEKKKRGRKPAFEYYATSACKRTINKKSEDVNNTIIQLDISDTEETVSMILPNDTLDKFKDLDIVERFYNELQKDNNASLEELYKIELDERKRQDCEFFSTLDKVDCNETNFTSSTNINDTILDTNYINILCDFVDIRWPNKTNILCWWCCKSFTGVPVGVPTKYDIKTKKYRAKGIFCGMNCMYAYTLDYDIINHKQIYKFNNKHKKISNLDSLIKDLNAKLTGASISDVLVPALPRESLIDFGGELSIDAFRRSTSNNMRIFNRIDYPFTVVQDVIEIKDIEMLKKYQELRNEGTDKIVIKEIVKPIQRQTIDSILNIEYD